nr:amidohydrolase family protein [Candidatus Cloacimonadota bacterium]
MKLLINALLPTSSTALRRVNMLFDEKIIKVSTDEIDAPDETEVIDAQGLILLPGGVDPHVHILGKAATAAKDVEKLSKTALEGGWTTLAELSYHTEEPVFDPTRLKSRKELFDKHSYVDMALWGQVDITDYPYHAEAAQELWGKGVVGISLCAPSPNPAVAEISFTEIMDLFLDIYESDTAFAFQGYDHELYPQY